MYNNFPAENLLFRVIAPAYTLFYTLSTPLVYVYQRDAYFINTLLIMCKVNKFPAHFGRFRV